MAPDVANTQISWACGAGIRWEWDGNVLILPYFVLQAAPGENL